MAGIQLIGKQCVIDAFETFELQTWALFQGKQLIVSGEGAGTLEEWLERFLPAGSTGQYTLRIYDTGLPVKAGTDYVAALNFKLHDTYGGAGIAGYSSKLEQRIAELEKGGSDDDEDEDDIGTIIMGWFKEPDKLQTAIGAFKQIFDKPRSLSAQTPQQTMAGVRNESGLSHDQEQRARRLAAVLDKLEERDPKILEHLEKLADANDFIFSMAIQQIDKL